MAKFKVLIPDNFGDEYSTTIEADSFVERNGILLFEVKNFTHAMPYQLYETVAMFAVGRWASVRKLEEAGVSSAS